VGEESGPLSTRLCAGCGVAVASGYIKCPRCHTELPLPRARRPLTEGGGTAMSGGGNRTVMLIGAAALALVVVVVWVFASGGSSAAVVPDAAVDDDVGDPEPDQVRPTPDREPPPPDRQPVDPTPPTPSVGRAELRDLGLALRGERLWATVTASGTTVEIGSSFCDDTGLVAIVDAHDSALRAARFTSVRCRAPHGGIVFEHGL